jgi:hypothetical protein
MTLGNYEIALIGIGGTVIGVLIGCLLTYHFSLKHAERVQRLDANRKLVHTFTSELADVYPTAVNWPDDIDKFLRQKFPNLQAAVGEFRFYLPRREWGAFDNAWFDYYCSTGREVDKKCQAYHHYMNLSGVTNNVEYTQNGHANLTKNIDHILTYAK